VTIGLATVAVALPLGLLLGLVAGWFGGWIDDLIGWLYSVVVSVPGILLVTAIAYAMGRGLLAISVALAATEWVGVMRLVRGEVLKHRAMEYVLAARVGGASTAQILFGEITPNVVHRGHRLVDAGTGGRSEVRGRAHVPRPGRAGRRQLGPAHRRWPRRIW
jgi:peptide/nickel transport system permease protein